MTRYQVDSDAVLTSAATTRGSIARLQAEAAGLHANLTGLQSTWSGSAAMAFASVLADWNSAYHRVEQSLSALNEALAQAGHGYAEVEHHTARMFGR